jgi:hypothetical protein
MDAPQGVPDPPFLRNVGLLLTYHCQAACAHCILRAGPDRHEAVKLDDARRWIRDIAAYRDRYVCVLSLTGGEPFSDLTLLRSVMQLAADAGLYVSVVTNGFWAARRDLARQVLESLPRICFLSVSTDAYHQEYVPFERVQNAIWAARECGVPYYVTIVTDNREGPEYRWVHAELLKTTPADEIRTGVVFPVGRALQIKDQLRFKLSEEPPKEACQAASSPCIFPDGRVFGCIGPLLELGDEHPLYLGNAHGTPLHDIFDRAEGNVILHALRLWGPGRLFTLLRATDLGSRLPKAFVEGSTCNACYALMSDPVVRDGLNHLAQNPDFQRQVAYARLHYLDETGMLEIAGVGG